MYDNNSKLKWLKFAFYMIKICRRSLWKILFKKSKVQAGASVAEAWFYLAYNYTRCSTSQEFQGINSLTTDRSKKNHGVDWKKLLLSPISLNCPRNTGIQGDVVWKWGCIIWWNDLQRAHTFLGRYTFLVRAHAIYDACTAPPCNNCLTL